MEVVQHAWRSPWARQGINQYRQYVLNLPVRGLVNAAVVLSKMYVRGVVKAAAVLSKVPVRGLVKGAGEGACQGISSSFQGACDGGLPRQQ